MTENSYPLQVTVNGKDVVGSYQNDCYTRKDALFQGAKMFLLALLASGLTIAIPLIHFITVPLGILASPLIGVYFFFARIGKPKRVIGHFFCPECQTENCVETEGIYLEYFGKCHQCGHDFKMVPSLPISRSER